MVQDIDGSEGTGIWSNTQATSLHVPAPTLSTAHYLRIASAYRGDRRHIKETFHGSFLPGKIQFNDTQSREKFIEDLRRAVYATCLVAYVQGMNIIDVADKENKWSINYPNIVQIWRAGCIIQSDYISSLLSPIYSSPSLRPHNLLYAPSIASELRSNFVSLKKIVAMGVESNSITPSMSASLEYLKYTGNLELPTQFYEAELDYFGKHMYDSKRKDEDPGKPETGPRHFEWKAA